jgi:hypothetical protein
VNPNDDTTQARRDKRESDGTEQVRKDEKLSNEAMNADYE